mgnify:CR=1 FL=1
MDIKEKIINNRAKILTVIGTLLVLSIISGIAYAYFGKLVINNTENAITQINTTFYTFNSTGANSISLTINETDLDVENATNNYTSFVSNSGGNITVTLDAKSTTPVYCTYDIVYVPSTAYMASQTTYNELTISGSSKNGGKISETSLNGSSKIVIGGARLIKTTSSKTTISDTWNFTLKYYNIEKPQDSIIGKTYKGNIKIENINCDYGDMSALSAKDYILALNGGESYVSSKSLFDVSAAATDNEGMYSLNDDLGKTYFFRGAINNNWVKFGKNSSNNDMYWRIIRINGDGSIRMLYAGTSVPTENEEYVGKYRNQIISSPTYVSDNSKPENIGYQYIDGSQHGYGKCDPSQTTCSTSNGTVYNSKMKILLENWFSGSTNLKTLYENGKIADQIVCNDRSGTYSSYAANYGGYNRFVLNGIFNPTFMCESASDRFTVNTDIGNGALTYPIGLITVDEMAFAGSGTGNNLNYFLYSLDIYWTVSPCNYLSGSMLVFTNSNGGIDYKSVFMPYGVRPVISLAKNVSLSGTGTYNDPYTVN